MRTAKDLPATLAEMEPLLAAIAHGCAARRMLDAYDEVYRRRILRGDEAFAIHRLGVFGADMGALRIFFPHPGGNQQQKLDPRRKQIS